MPSTTSKAKGKPHKPLRQLAAEKTHGRGANPSLLGDPISLVAETTSDDIDVGGKTPNTTAGSTLAKKTQTTMHGTTSIDDQTKRDTVNHDNGPSAASGSVFNGGRSSKL